MAGRTQRVVVVGAGVGGLTAAADLARQGCAVTVVDRAAGPGGKIRQLRVDGAGIDAGPTVFTMRWVFESLFADAGTTLGDELALTPAAVLARHAWALGGQLDLYGDIERTVDAIGRFAGSTEAQAYRDFCARGADMYATLRPALMAAQRPNPWSLGARVGWLHIDRLLRTAPLTTLWTALGQHFRDPRLRQLFGRYATYVGSSPAFAPAALMVVAHVEREGVWLVDGGMRRVADALQRLGARHGAEYRYGTGVARIVVAGGRVAGVELDGGERLPADAVVFNGDISALGDGLLGDAVRGAARRTPRHERSLSAITWCLKATTRGFALEHHNVFFADDYLGEFAAIFGHREVPQRPTVYVCAQDRGHGTVPAGPERLLVLINAPPDGDRHDFDAALPEYRARALALLRDCGLDVDDTGPGIATTPTGFARLFPASGGALYGPAARGAVGVFRRGAAWTRVPGLYLAGGSVHPGPGVPMAALSGRLAAAKLLVDAGA
ncbi:MAG: phytoene desaturase [Chromatiales bacterium]|jgi:1-hydroxycarotenoid 3,4-desaturase|nr:phytoene desaturase [Chromatiales bacterium]